LKGSGVTNKPALFRDAVVYIQEDTATYRYQVIYQRGTNSTNARVIYETGRYTKGNINPVSEPPPIGFGILPSPDGCWLHIWETFDRKGDAPIKTIWFALELSSNRLLKIGEQPRGRTGYFPFWLDNYRLSLERGEKNTIFDVRTGRLTNPLPPRTKEADIFLNRDIDEAGHLEKGDFWRRQFIRHNFARELKILKSALGSLKKELNISNYLRVPEYWQSDTPEDLLLRPMGIVHWGNPGRSKLIWPSVAVSADGTKLVRSAFLLTGRKMIDSDRKQILGYSYTASIDVFALPSGKHLWGKSVPQPIIQVYDRAYEFSHARVTMAQAPWFKDPRWSRDGRYLAFSTINMLARGIEPREVVSVLDAKTWKVVMQIPSAEDAFIIPAVK
jgi:hypothetical protein